MEAGIKVALSASAGSAGSAGSVFNVFACKYFSQLKKVCFSKKILLHLFVCFWGKPYICSVERIGFTYHYRCKICLIYKVKLLCYTQNS